MTEVGFPPAPYVPIVDLINNEIHIILVEKPDIKLIGEELYNWL